MEKETDTMSPEKAVAAVEEKAKPLERTREGRRRRITTKDRTQHGQKKGKILFSLTIRGPYNGTPHGNKKKGKTFFFYNIMGPTMYAKYRGPYNVRQIPPNTGSAPLGFAIYDLY